MRVEVTIGASTGAEWRGIQDEVWLRLDEVLSPRDKAIEHRDASVRFKASKHTAARIWEIFEKTGLINRLNYKVTAILPQEDEHERKVQEKLYPAGDTSNKPKERTERVLPSSVVNDAEALKKAGVRPVFEDPTAPS
jgi:hypothetical protein